MTNRQVLGALRRLYGKGPSTRVVSDSRIPSGPEVVDRLISDSPKLHYVSENDARWLSERGINTGPGPTSWAVPAQVLRYFSTTVKPDHLTIETGAGHSTVAFAALAKRHTCITIDQYCVEATKSYMEGLEIPLDRVSFIVESSDTALPNLSDADRFDFAYIDGGHGYPLPALDWHYIDKHLKIGGIIGFDNTEIPSVHNHCEFLEINRTYRLVENISGPSLGRYGAYFYMKLVDQPRSDITQLYNRRRVTGMFPQDQEVWPWN